MPLVLGAAQLQTLLACKAPAESDAYSETGHYRETAIGAYGEQNGSSARAEVQSLVLPSDDGAIFGAALRVFEEFSAALKSLPGMPLQILSVTPAAPELRYTAVLPPVTHPLAHAAGVR